MFLSISYFLFVWADCTQRIISSQKGNSLTNRGHTIKFYFVLFAFIAKLQFYFLDADTHVSAHRLRANCNGGLGWFGVTDGRLPPLESSSECDSNVDSEVSSHSLHYQTGWLLYLPFTYLSWLYYVPQAVHIRSSYILLHTEGDDVRGVLNEKERKKSRI